MQPSDFSSLQQQQNLAQQQQMAQQQLQAQQQQMWQQQQQQMWQQPQFMPQQGFANPGFANPGFGASNFQQQRPATGGDMNTKTSKTSLSKQGDGLFSGLFGAGKEEDDNVLEVKL